MDPTLLEIKQIPKVNAQSIGNQANFEYLGLILSQAEFVNINKKPFIHLADPRTLQIPEFTPHHEVVHLQKDFQQHEDRYKGCINVKKAIKKQLFNAIDSQLS